MTEAQARAHADRWWGSIDEDMAAFASAFGYTPTEFRDLTYRDYKRLRASLTKK